MLYKFYVNVKNKKIYSNFLFIGVSNRYELKGEKIMGKENLRLRNNGITLVALVITIVVILILSGVTIGLVTSQNGVIKTANSAKEKQEIEKEKGIVERSALASIMQSKNYDMKKDNLQSNIDKEAGVGNVEVSDAGNIFDVVFIETNRVYEVEKTGKVTGPEIIPTIDYAGDITKGGKYDGSAEKPYQIDCIEDLVSLSNISNKTGIKFVNGKATEITQWESFKDEYVVLTRNLNFNSFVSYANCARTDYGDLNGDGKVEGIRTELTRTDEGCTGFPTMGRGVQFVTFDGQNNRLDNIYMYYNGESEKGIALFSEAKKISNLIISGKVLNKKGDAASISLSAQFYSSEIDNCINYADVTGYGGAGGISARTTCCPKNF